MAIDEQAFEAAKEKIVGALRQRFGIGTLSEKTVHAILKNYYEPDEDRQEIPIEKYVADIYADGQIIEIQTGQFNRMRDKLTTFLSLYPVTIVYPIPKEKWLIWIDEETGQLSKKHKSPAKGSAYTAFPEFYKIKNFLKHKNLRIRLVFLDVEEYRLLNGWSKDKKRGSSRYDRIPVKMVEEVELTCPQDYLQFIPYELAEPFTVKEFGKAAHIPAHIAQTVLNILFYLECVERVGKKGNAFLYQVREPSVSAEK